MSRNRRNKRSSRSILEVMSSKTFITLTIILAIIIVICSVTIFYRNNKEKKILAEQRAELEKNIEAIFEETEKNIANSNNTVRDSIIRISAVGDILCENSILEDAYDKGTQNYDFTSMFKNMSTFFADSDITVGTMETNYTDNKYSGYGQRNSPISFAEALKNIGIDLVSISTNHSLDYGIEGLQETKRALEGIGYDVVGDNLGESRVKIKTIKNTKIAFLSYTYGFENQNSKTKEELDSANIYNSEIAKKDLEYAKENADYSIIIMHWGDAYSTKPNKEQQNIAKFLVENGADMILGNHASAVQKMEVMQSSEGKNVLVAYSLGNYISGETMDISKIELVLNIELRKSGETGEVVLSKVDYTPIYVLDRGTKAENRYELIDMKGTAKAYAEGNKKIVNKETYNKLVEGLKKLEGIIK
jgi:poly-gamma-glutamate capsule biosynthesis protein CapA/YwtB (metallophosphatase superfamily)